MNDPPAFLPPRRPSSLPNLTKARSSWHISTQDAPAPLANPPSFPPARRPSPGERQRTSTTERPFSGSNLISKPPNQDNTSRPTSFQSLSSGGTAAISDLSLQRTASDGSDYAAERYIKSDGGLRSQTTRLKPIHEPLKTDLASPRARSSQIKPPVVRQSSLRIESRLSEEDLERPALPPSVLGASHSDPQFTYDRFRPYSHPHSDAKGRPHTAVRPVPSHRKSPLSLANDDPWRVPPLTLSRSSTTASQRALSPKPAPSFIRLSSLDNLMTYREEKAEWKHASSIIQLAPSNSDSYYGTKEQVTAFDILNSTPPSIDNTEKFETLPLGTEALESAPEESTRPTNRSKFRHFWAEVGFCFTIAMTQYLAEYLISGFAIELANLLGNIQSKDGSMGIFWPASLLSLILSATLLIFARLSDLYGGYFVFLSGVAWLAIWTLIPGFCRSAIMLDVSRAMQGLAIAAFMPSTFTMVGSIYSEGPRRNIVMGLYSGCAPLGFFTGFLVAGAMPKDKPQWYFWIASALSLITFITAFLTVPSDRTDRRKLGLKMDWVGSYLITSGLILVAYALSVEPFANQDETARTGFAFPIVFGPLAAGLACLVVAIWYERWCATCPLLPFDFFRPRSVKSFSLACLCFYASYGVWLYNSAGFFQSPNGSTGAEGSGLSGMTLALWYTPTAIGGIVLCIVGGSLMHIVPIMVLLLLSAFAWIAAPLLFAVAPLPLEYWSYVVPSMLCATIGIDLTFTISIVFFSSVQPLRYQGLSGAICSILVNLAMSFALSISEIVMKKAESTIKLDDGPSAGERSPADQSINWGFRATFVYAAASGGVGLLICILFVRISRSVVRAQPADEERQRPTSSDSTLVGEGDERHGRGEIQGNVTAAEYEA